MGGEAWHTVEELQAAGLLLVEDGNHGESRPRRDEFATVGTAFIRAADMSHGRVNFAGCEHINDVARARIRKGIGRPSDILLSHKGTVGKLAWVSADAPPFVCSPQTTFWRVLNDSLLDRGYLYAFMRSRLFETQLASVQGETDMAPYVSLTAQRRLKVAIPNFREQVGISHLLGALDDKIELNRRMAETLETMAQALFKSWFVDFDPVHAKAEGRPTGLADDFASLFPDRFREDGVPEGWFPQTLAALADLNPESWTRANYPQHINYVDLANTKWGTIESVESHTKASAPSRAQRVLRPNDTIIGTVRPGNGSYALISDDGLTGSTGFAVLRPKKPQYREIVYLASTETGNIERLVNLADGGAYPAVRPHVVMETKIAGFFARTADAFCAIVAPKLDCIAANRRESATLAALRDALLPKLISGELRAADAEQRIAAA